MPVMQRIVKPKTQRAKRALLSREPQLVEDEKQMMFLKGTKCPSTLTSLMRDLVSLRKPLAQFYSRKNELRPFDDVTPLENFARQHHCPLFGFGNGTKKRPNNLVLGRMFDFHLLDMVEFEVGGYKSMADFKSKSGKPPLGTKPVVVFSGDDWTRDPDLVRVRNLFLDIFRGPSAEKIRLQGLESAIVLTVVEGKIFFRHYKILLKKSGQRTPRVETEEIGPRFELSLRRTKLASEELFKTACRKPKELKTKKKKNMSKDSLGTTTGRVHMTKQNLDELQTRKLKGLKRKSGGKSESPAKRQKTVAVET